MKVAIVGAGICGLYLAWRLAERGHEVTVFEKRGKIGKETCSGLFSERILEFIPESQKLIQNQINYCLIHFLYPHTKSFGVRARRTLQIKFTRKFFVMNHFELDELVANLAKRAGANIILNQEIQSLPEGFDRVIGCDGATSIIRKSLGLSEPSYRLGIQGFIACPAPSEPRPFSEKGGVETWPTASGFLWKIPRGNGIEYGIIEKSESARKLFDEFLKIKGIKLERINSAIVPQGLIISSNPKITLCGDAVGLTKPWSGGGVIWGLTSAEILLKNFPDFLKYQKELKKFFLTKIIFSKVAKKLIYFLGFKIPWILPKNYKIESDFLI